MRALVTGAEEARAAGRGLRRPDRLGGQAVLEGVMVRADDQWAVAVRRPDGVIVSERSTVPRWAGTARRVPVVRGMVALVATISLGMRALSWSRAVLDAAGEGEETSRAQVLAATVLSLSVFLTLFALGPAVGARLLVGHGAWFGVVESVLRLLLFVGYIVAIGRLPGIRRTFEYHGAEHQAIAAFEAGEVLELERVRRFSPRHARCGTDFLVLVGMVAIVVFAAVAPEGWVALGLSRVLLLPVVAGIAYEVLRVSDRPWAHRWLRPVMAPGMAVQRLTTRTPDDHQIEVAIAAVVAALE